MRLKICLVLLLCAVQASATAAANYAWTEITIAGESVPSGFGPNDKGQIPITKSDGTSGIYQKGVFTPLLVPPASAGVQVFATGINNSGVIVGGATNLSNGHQQGFILANGAYTFFSRSGWDNTVPRSVSNSGVVVGTSSQDITFESAGFIYNPATGVFTDVTPAGSTFPRAQGINSFGRIAGMARDSGGRFGFIWQRDPVTFNQGTRVLAPFIDRFRISDSATNARGINDLGVTVGDISSTSGGEVTGFVGSSFLGYQMLLPPGADAAGAQTLCAGINNFGQVTCLVIEPLTFNTRFFFGSPQIGQ